MQRFPALPLLPFNTLGAGSGRARMFHRSGPARAPEGSPPPSHEANLALGHAEDERDYAAAAQMLAALGAHSVRLLSNNPDKAAQLAALGIEVAEQLPTGVHLFVANHRYLTAKRDHTGHRLELPVDVGPVPEADMRQPARGPANAADPAAGDAAPPLKSCSPRLTVCFPGSGSGPRKPTIFAAYPTPRWGS
jgi:hypothetical protein